MPERYKIDYQPYQDDPNDPRSVFRQDQLFTEVSWRTGSPGMTDEIYAEKTDHRPFLIVVKEGSEVVRILRAPLRGAELPEKVWDEAMGEVMSEIGKKYPHPKYDRGFGGSCLEDALRAWPAATNSHRIPIENIAVTPVAGA